MTDIFISHVEEDSAVVLEIAQGLEAVGYTTWYYERDSVPGLSYLVQTGQAIEESRAVVLVVSPASLASNQVSSEVVRAHEAGKSFLPVLCGITHAEFQQRQPLWRQAVGSAASISVPAAGLSAILPRIIAGLKSLEVQPGGKATASITHGTGAQGRGTRAIEAKRPQVVAGAPSVKKRGLKQNKWLLVWLGVFVLQDIIIVVLALRLIRLTAHLAAIKPVVGGPILTESAVPRPTQTLRPATLTPRSSPTGVPQAAATATALPKTSTIPNAPIQMATVTSTPQLAPTGQPVHAFNLPRNDPGGVAYDGSALWVTFGGDWTKLELVEAEQRFRDLDEQSGFPSANLAWDLSWEWYWALMDSSVDVINRSGVKTASYALPQEGLTPLDIAWDGKSLWALHGDGTLQRFEPRADTFQLKKVDSYAPRLARVGLEEPTGLTWDGSDLWVISTGSVFKLSDTAQPVCTIEVGPWPFVHEFGGLAWDGRFLWTTDAYLGVLYRVDPNQCAK